MRRKSADIIHTKTGDYVQFHFRLTLAQYNELWDVADEQNVDITSLIRQAINMELGKYSMSKKSHKS